MHFVPCLRQLKLQTLSRDVTGKSGLANHQRPTGNARMWISPYPSPVSVLAGDWPPHEDKLKWTNKSGSWQHIASAPKTCKMQSWQIQQTFIDGKLTFMKTGEITKWSEEQTKSYKICIARIKLLFCSLRHITSCCNYCPVVGFAERLQSLRFMSFLVGWIIRSCIENATARYKHLNLNECVNAFQKCILFFSIFPQLEETPIIPLSLCNFYKPAVDRTLALGLSINKV